MLISFPGFSRSPIAVVSALLLIDSVQSTAQGQTVLSGCGATFPYPIYADMFSAMGTESRLRIMQLLLSAHPDGLVVGEIGNELEIPSSTLSHHLEKLKNEDLVKVRREGTFLWYSANIEVLQELLGFFYAECCTRNKAIEPKNFISICK
jgi:DNA-binding transcriptional ArsR family regulator